MDDVDDVDDVDDYVTNAAWLRQAGRVDAVDVVGDEFERPVARGVEAFWSAESATPWPRSPRGWRSLERMHARSAARTGADSMV